MTTRVLVIFGCILSPIFAETLYHEDFETGWNGWTTDRGGWNAGSPSMGPGGGHESSACASIVVPPGQETLRSMWISPVLSLPAVPGDERLELRFWEWSDGLIPSPRREVQIAEGPSSDPGPFVTLSGYVPNRAGWFPVSMDLTPYAGKTVQIAFPATASLETGAQWYIDDVSIVQGITTQMGDLTWDGKVDISDLVMLAESWLTPDRFCDIAPLPYGDGIVNLLDFAALSQTLVLKESDVVYSRYPADKQFARTSVGYVDNGSGLIPVPENVERKRLVAVCSPSDGVMRVSDNVVGVGPVPIRVICSTATHLFGHNASTKTIYRSTDGDTWTALVSSSPTCHLFVTSTGRILRWENAGVFMYNNNPKAWYSVSYSDNEGQTWTAALDNTGNYYFSGLPTDWSVKEHNGTIIAAEYGSASYYPAYIHRSTDNGATWSAVHQQAAGTIGHYHAVGYHAGKDLWLCNTGDGVGKRYLLISNDDGRTWHSYLEGKQDNANQVTRYLDYGHPTRILCGSDSYGQVVWLDLETWDVGQVQSQWENQVVTTYSAYCFLLFKHDNVYYACQMDNRTAGIEQGVISVSTDLEHWTVYHRINNAFFAGGRYFAGYFNGKLHLAISDRTMTIYQHLVLSPATVVNKTGLLLEPVAKNRFTEEQCSAETGKISDWQDGGMSPDIKDFDSTTAYHGVRSVHVAKWGSAVEVGCSTSVEPGSYYIGRVYARGKTGQALVDLDTPSSNYRPRYLLNPEWKPYCTEVRQATDNTMSLSVLTYPRNSDGLAEVWVDALYLESFPCSFFQIGGTTKAKDEYRYSVWAGRGTVIPRQAKEGYSIGDWQDDFTFHPHIGSHLITNYADKMYLRTYKRDTLNYASVYYKANEKKFYLEVADDGVVSAQATAVTSFLMDATVRIKVTMTDGNLKMDVASGQPYISTPNIPGPATGFFGKLTIIAGDINGDNLFPHTLSEDGYMDTVH
jgi:hypothetical protein